AVQALMTSAGGCVLSQTLPESGAFWPVSGAAGARALAAGAVPTRPVQQFRARAKNKPTPSAGTRLPSTGPSPEATQTHFFCRTEDCGHGLRHALSLVRAVRGCLAVPKPLARKVNCTPKMGPAVGRRQVSTLGSAASTGAAGMAGLCRLFGS